MNEELIKFIELCLMDGVISDKEREVILRKAKKIGVDEDECEILIDSFAQKANSKPIVSTNEVVKPKRSYTPNQVRQIKPAALNKEEELSKEVMNIKEKEKNLLSNYDLTIEYLKVSNEDIKNTKKNFEDEFKKYKNNYEKSNKSLNEKYIKMINQEISKRFGETEIILTTEQKNSFIDLSLNEKEDFILKNSKWNSISLNKKRRKKRNIWYLVSLLPILYAIIEAEFDMDDMKSANWWLLIVGFFIIIIGTNYNEQIKENKMNFNDDDLKVIIDIVNKSLKKSFDELELSKNLIDNYISLTNYSLTVP